MTPKHRSRDRLELSLPETFDPLNSDRTDPHYYLSRYRYTRPSDLGGASNRSDPIAHAFCGAFNSVAIPASSKVNATTTTPIHFNVQDNISTVSTRTRDRILCNARRQRGRSERDPTPTTVRKRSPPRKRGERQLGGTAAVAGTNSQPTKARMNNKETRAYINARQV